MLDTHMEKSLILNSTQIPNIIFDEWMAEITPAEFKVVMTIARQTYGWHKETDRIAYSQLEYKTGYSKDTLTIAVKALRASGKIIVTDSEGNQLYTKEECRGKSLYYKLNIQGVGKSDKLVTNVSENPSRKIRHTKETNTKELLLRNSCKTSSSSLKSEKCFNNNGHEGCIENMEDLEKNFGKRFTNWGMQLKYFHQIYKAGYKDKDIEGVIHQLEEDPFWSSEGWDMATIAKKLSKGGKYGTANQKTNYK